MIVNTGYDHIYWYLGGTIGDIISILCPWPILEGPCMIHMPT